MIDIGMYVGGGFIVLGALAGLFIWWRRRKRPLDKVYFKKEWRELQKLLKNKERWDVALLQADNLLDIALKKNRIRGHNMGERLVKAQRLFSDNDSVWFGHKLRNKVESEPDMKLKEKEIKQALVGIRQALKDLGALPDGK
ncbi:MAG: hypothetical protein ACREGD_02200 [Candidatus Saccharimonadales bacterium]